jgi:hypothetical protein
MQAITGTMKRLCTPNMSPLYIDECKSFEAKKTRVTRCERIRIIKSANECKRLKATERDGLDRKSD